MPALSSGREVVRIAVLEPRVADAIAAGEVIDRPAAVVKELIENALDAEATRIVIRVDGAGSGQIEVVDDGLGIPGADLALAFRRHATSKVRSLEDLHRLSTLGFRGEALASIAAVAEVEAVSRVRGRGEGHRVRIAAGVVQDEGAASSPGGTRISVSRLFFNTPARRQFLKQPATENAIIVRVAADLALAHPEVAVRLELDRRVALASPGGGDLRAACAAVYDEAIAAALLPVQSERVTGLLAPPAIHRASREHVVLLVNGRRIHHRNLVYAVAQAYRGLREGDRFPIAILDLRIDPAQVDVNVHPTKREVRFQNEGAVFAAVERACFHALRSSPLYALQAPDGVLQLRESASALEARVPVAEPPPSQAHPAAGPAAVPPRPELEALTFRAQVLNAYLVAEAGQALVLIDQHAAHERVLFDRLQQRLRSDRPGSQLALVPPVLELTPNQLAAFAAHREFLEDLGFLAEPFGHHTLRVTAAPLEVPERLLTRVLERLLEDLEQERTPDRRLHETAALIACHSAVRFGDPMTAAEATALLHALASTDEPISCPHGRPTTLVLHDEQLRRLFKRP